MAENTLDPPLFLIWTNPRKALQKIVATDPYYLTFPLAFASSLDRIFFAANQGSLGVLYSYRLLLGLSIVLAIVYAFLWLQVFGRLLYFLGKSFGGAASLPHVQAALAWGGAPQLLSLSVWFAFLLFSPEYTFVKMQAGIPLFFLYLIMLIPSVWSLAASILALQEVQQFSLGKAIGNWSLFFFLFLLIQEIAMRSWVYFLTFI